MGKPFAKELEKVDETLEWGMKQQCGQMANEILYNGANSPLYVVGSGGSLSACYYAVLLYQQHGLMGKAVTPLELYYSQNTLRTSNVLFISASGRNNDILFGYKTAIKHEPRNIFSISMKLATPLGKLSAENSVGKHFEFELPAGKDGFLATNSLIGFFSVLYKGLGNAQKSFDGKIEIEQSYFLDLDNFIKKVNPDFTFTILYAGWGHPVAIDIESKLAEAALGDVLISDIRNFGHGRHHWFDKRKSNSAIIALITPEEAKITEKTLSLLPNDIPVLILKSNITDGRSSIELLIKSFYFVQKLGEIQNIDPGKPGVPDFGSKLYHLKYSSFYKTKDPKNLLNEKIAIIRKTQAPTFHHLNTTEKTFWKKAYKDFKEKINNEVFGSIILDYDGTICSAENRWEGLTQETAKLLINLLEQEIILGIATGRGKSVRLDLQKVIPEKYWPNIVIGYYNGSDIGRLNDDELPNKFLSNNNSLKEIDDLLKSYNFPYQVDSELKPNQLTIMMQDKNNWNKVRSTIIQLIMNKGLSNIQILESAHSMDIIDEKYTSKIKVADICVEIAKMNKKSASFLAIGDKGIWPGNDFQLLSSKFSLSVDEVSALNDSCWNLAEAGIKNTEAMNYYLSHMEYSIQGFKINLP